MGKKSSAAGKYQFIAPTWDAERAKLKLPDFSPESQDAAAWDLASTRYNKATGGNLAADLSVADDAGVARIAHTLAPIWTSLPGGIERSGSDAGFLDAYKKGLGSPITRASGNMANVRLAQTNGPSLNALVQAYSDPWMPQNSRDILKLYIDKQLKAGTPDYDIVKADDGTLIRINKNTGKIETLHNGTGRKLRPAASEETNPIGVAPSTPPAISGDDNSSISQTGESRIDRGESSFDQELGTGLAKVYVDQVQQGIDAVDTKTGIQQIRQLMENKGLLDGFAAAIAPYVPRGWLPEGANDIVAAQAIISGLIPKQRVPGSGPRLDFDAQQFAKSLPSVWNKPGANKLIADTFDAYADYRIAVGDIIQEIGSDPGVKNKARAINDAMKKLPDPFTRWKEYVKSNPIEEAHQKPTVPTTGLSGDNRRRQIGPPDADGWITMPDGTQIREKK